MPLLSSLLGLKGSVDVISEDNGPFFFQFGDPKDKDEVLLNGPWFVAGRLQVLRPWRPKLETENTLLSTIPIWIKLFGLPKHFWTPNGISYVASAIGRPLHMDEATENRSRLSFAKQGLC